MTLSRPKILVIDDVPENLELLIAALKDDFDLQIATSGARGLDYASQSTPDLILLDVMMPEMDGFEVCRRIKGAHQLQDIPVIFLTALGDAQDESFGLELGAADYITKPINVVTAQRRIRNLLEREGLRNVIQAQFNELKQASDLLQASRQRELEFGNVIQRTLLQGVIPKGIEGANISSFSQPSQVVDGDFSDIRRIHTNSFEVLVGDVMGKGVSAALIGAGIRSAYQQVLADLQIVKSFGTLLPTPEEIVNQLHRVLTPRLAELSTYVTLALYRFDLEAGTLTYVNAGHTPGLLRSATQGQVLSIEGTNLPIGILADEVYVEICVPIGPGDSLLVYSDGITEARNPEGEQFGQARLINAFETGKAAALVPFTLLESLQQSLRRFTSGAPVQDDKTAIIVEWPSHVVPLTRSLRTKETAAQTLHRRAEAVARNFLTEASRSDRFLSPDKAQQVLYELRVYQVELELQAEELKRTQRKLEADIVERKRMELQVHQLAFYDPLTQLANRRLLKDRLSQALLASKRSGFYSALMFLDLDNFKPLNDQHGHSAGDLLLTAMAARLKACVREIDTVARFGGDEFVVLLDELSLSREESMAQAGVIAEKIRVALAEPYVLGMANMGADAVAVEHRCTTSMGVTLFTHSEDSQDEILMRADSAMYQAKAQGRNRVRFYDSQTVASVLA
ncbi:MAG: SpoIIE family protein phosphatase [Rhodoferax sp.]|uniref:SpoIIE family protein phosphatase n=1 Tax=Rhodoferax sp. TaxID=50421 RepID=UPI00301AC56A